MDMNLGVPTFFLFRFTEIVDPHRLSVSSDVLVSANDSVSAEDIMGLLLAEYDRQPMATIWRGRQPRDNRFVALPGTRKYLTLSLVDYSEVDWRTFETLSIYLPSITLQELAQRTGSSVSIA